MRIGDFVAEHLSYEQVGTSDLRRRFREHILLVAPAMKAIEWNNEGDGDEHENDLIREIIEAKSSTMIGRTE
jgi:hypothetical protein